jgi:small subunit ribosomal protein S21
MMVHYALTRSASSVMIAASRQMLATASPAQSLFTAPASAMRPARSGWLACRNHFFLDKHRRCASPGDVNGENGCMQIVVRDNNVDQALRALKKKLQREGVYREMKLRRHYEKPSEKRAREKAAAIRRARKLERKRAERDGIK